MSEPQKVEKAGGAALPGRTWEFQFACFPQSGSIGFQKLKWASREAREGQLCTVAGFAPFLLFCGNQENPRKRNKRSVWLHQFGLFAVFFLKA